MKRNKINIKFDFKLKLFLLISIIIISILIGLIIVSFKNEKATLKKYDSDYISFVYDNNFKIVNEEEFIELKNNNKSSIIAIKKMDYTNNAKTKNKSEIASSLSYQVISNQDYIKTYDEYKNENGVTKYYCLYENYEEEKQIEVVVMFGENDIYVVVYSANNNEFDLYFESVSIIIDSIKV